MFASRWIAPLVAAAAVFSAVQTAQAAVSSPPAFPREVTVFPERDFVVVDGWPGNTDFKIEVLRGGVVVGSALGTTDAAGLGEVNHPGGFCWTGFTPDILPGDVVRAVEVDGTGTPILDAGGQPIGDATRTAGVAAQAAENVGGQLVVHGTAVAADGGPIPVGDLEQRMINPDLVPLVGRRDVRAPGGGNGFTSALTYDPVGPGNPDGLNWTATYTGLSTEAVDTAVAGQTRIMSWMALVTGERAGITIFEVGEVGGPGFGGCPLGARNAVTEPGVLNAARLAPGSDDVMFAGAAQPDATDVALSITDGTTTVDMPAVAATSGAWTAAVPVSQLATLADGTLTASGLYTVSGGTVTGSTLDVVKDTVAPAAPTASPAPGTYESAQVVRLSSGDPSAQVHYTTDGSDPTATSPVAPEQLSITSSQTVRAIAVDAAGNPGEMAVLAYAIEPRAPVVVAAPIIVNNTTPRPVAAPERLALIGRVTLASRISRRTLSRRGLRASVRVPRGTEVLRARLFRVSGGRRRLVTTAFRFPSRAGLYRLVLRSKGVRRLLRGRYVLEITPGQSRQSLGAPSQRGFQIR